MDKFERRNHRKETKERRLFVKFIVIVGLLLLGTTATTGHGQSEATGFIAELRTTTQEAITQLSVAIRITLFAHAKPTLEDVRIDSAKVLNILVGEDNELYDADVAMPFGLDGEGVIPKIRHVRSLLEPHAQSDARIQSWISALDNMNFFSEVARDELFSVISRQDDRNARIAVRKTVAFLLSTRGSNQDPVTEGGARALQQDAEDDQGN